MASSSEAPDTVSISKGTLVARWALVVLAIFLIIFLRTPEAVLQPSLEAEDGTFVFPYYYANRGAVDLLRLQGGYIPLALNLIAYLSVRLPTRFIPFGFALAPASAWDRDIHLALRQAFSPMAWVRRYPGARLRVVRACPGRAIPHLR